MAIAQFTSIHTVPHGLALLKLAGIFYSFLLNFGQIHGGAVFVRSSAKRHTVASTRGALLKKAEIF